MVNGQIKDTVNDYNIKHRLCQYIARGIISNRNISYYILHKKQVIIQYKYNKKYQNQESNFFMEIVIEKRYIKKMSWGMKIYSHDGKSWKTKFGFCPFSLLIGCINNLAEV